MVVVQNIDFSFGSQISGFDKRRDVYTQISLLETFFEKNFFLNTIQEKLIQKISNDKIFLLIPFFEELVLGIEEVKNSLYLRKAVSSLYRKYKNEMKLDNNIRHKYDDGYQRTNKLITSMTELCIKQGDPRSLIIIPFDFSFEKTDPNIVTKKIFYPNINNQFYFGLYETVIAKIIFGNDVFGEDILPIICPGDELTADKKGVLPNTPCLEYDDTGMVINSIPKTYPHSPVGYFKGFIHF